MKPALLCLLSLLIPLSALSEDFSDSRYIAENICISNAPEAFEQAMDLLYLQHPDTDLYCGSFVVDEDNEYYRLVDGVLYSGDMSVLYGYPCGKRDWYFQVPSSVKAIVADAFSGNRHLRELVIPDSVAQIGAFAFHNTAVERLHLPSGEFEAGAEAFGWMPELREIILCRGCCADVLFHTDEAYLDLVPCIVYTDEAEQEACPCAKHFSSSAFS